MSNISTIVTSFGDRPFAGVVWRESRNSPGGQASSSLEFVEERLHMDDVVKSLPARLATAADMSARPTREEAEAAVRTLIRWTGDDPTREGLQDTPARGQGVQGVLLRLQRRPVGSSGQDFRARSKATMTSCWCAISPSTPIASTTWCRSSAWRMSPITRPRAWSGSPSSPVSSTSLPAGFRPRRP